MKERPRAVGHVAVPDTPPTIDLMRIIAGEFRSRRLLTPPDAETTRPIPDRVKESVFAILRGHVEDAVVFDAFAGTGAVGLEALSRGARRCVFVEKDRAAAEILDRNIKALDVQSRCDIVVGDALGPGALARCPRPVKLVFLDPPYPLIRDHLGFKRIKAQAEALIKLLADDGYLMLRAPLPLTHEELPTDAEAGLTRRQRAEFSRRPGAHGPGHTPGQGSQAPARRGPKVGKLRPDEWEREIWSTERHTPEELEELLDEAVEEGVEPPTDEPVQPNRVEVPLVLEGAVGPETHEYGGMAVHFYMRARSIAEPPPEAPPFAPSESPDPSPA